VELEKHKMWGKEMNKQKFKALAENLILFSISKIAMGKEHKRVRGGNISNFPHAFVN
jgi:hypothetical protein